jgi:hypothetical protein
MGIINKAAERRAYYASFQKKRAKLACLILRVKLLRLSILANGGVARGYHLATPFKKNRAVVFQRGFFMPLRRFALRGAEVGQALGQK